MRGCKRTRAHPRRLLSGRSQGVVYDVDYGECEGPSGTRLDSGAAGGWPLRTGPSWTRSYGGPRGLSVGGGGCEGRSGDIMHLELQQFFLFMFLGGPPNSVQFQSTGRSSCMLLGTVMVVDVLVNCSDKLRQFIFVVGCKLCRKIAEFSQANGRQSKPKDYDREKAK